MQRILRKQYEVGDIAAEVTNSPRIIGRKSCKNWLKGMERMANGLGVYGRNIDNSSFEWCRCTACEPDLAWRV